MSAKKSDAGFLFTVVVIMAIAVSSFFIFAAIIPNKSGSERTTEGQIVTVEPPTTEGENVLWSFTTLSNKGNTWNVDLLVSDESVVFTPGMVVKVTGDLQQFTDFDLVCPLDSYEIISSP